MKSMMFIKHHGDYNPADTPEALYGAMGEFMELHQLHWPGFEGVSELRPFEVETE
jgi:hypothetical protein